MCQAGDPRTVVPDKIYGAWAPLPKVVCFGLFDRKLARCGLFSFVFTREYTVRRSEMLLVFLGPVVFGFVALLVVMQAVAEVG